MSKKAENILYDFLPIQDINHLILNYSEKSPYIGVVATLKEFYIDHYIDNIYNEDSFKDYFFNNCNIYFYNGNK